MGYTVNGGGTIYVPPEKEADALAALKAWGEENAPIPWGDNARLADAESVQESWHSIFGDSYDTDPDPDGNPGFAFDHGDSWAQEYDAAAMVLGPFASEHSGAEWEGEEGEHWRWRFTGSEAFEEYAELVYPPDAAKAAADAAALDKIAELLRLPEWNIGGSMCDWIDCVADYVRPVRDIEIAADAEFSAECGYPVEEVDE